jgi:flagellar biosynthetic protein FliQ
MVSNFRAIGASREHRSRLTPFHFGGYVEKGNAEAAKKQFRVPEPASTSRNKKTNVAGTRRMTSDVALQLTGELLWTALLISAPILGLTLLVGLLVSVMQVVTQVQEMSLTFVPKIIAAVVAIIVFGPWMLRKLVLYSSSLIANIPGYF